MFSSEVRAKIQNEIDNATETHGWSEQDKAVAELLFFTKSFRYSNGLVRYYGFNGGGAASTKQKNYVRFLLNKHAGKREAEILRTELNRVRLSGDPIDRQTISGCIEVLQGL